MKLPLAFFMPKQRQNCCCPEPDPVTGQSSPGKERRVPNLSEPPQTRASHCSHCDGQLSKILFLILIFKRNFFVWPGWARAPLAVACGSKAAMSGIQAGTQQGGADSQGALPSQGCVDSVPSALLPGPGATKRDLQVMALLPCSAGSCKLSIFCLCDSYSGQTEVTTSPKTSQVSAILFFI